MRKLLTLVFCVSFVAFLSAQQKPVVTVLDFSKEGVSDSEMKSIISLISSSLFRTGKYQVIDVAQRDILLKEIEFSASSCSDESCQVEVGKMLSAELIVVGNLGEVGTKWILAAKVLETGSGRTESTADGVYADLDELVKDIPNLVAQLTGTTLAGASSRPAALRWKAVAGWGCLGIGAGGLGVGGYLLWDALSYRTDTVAPAQAAYEEQVSGNASTYQTLYDSYLAAYESYRGRLSWSIGALGGGAALAVAGTVLLLVPDRTAKAAPSVSIELRPAGPAEAGLLVLLRY